MISKRESQMLATKLGSEPEPGGRHMKVKVYVDGLLETVFGFSHDAKKPNPHIARSLRIPLSDTQALARCDKTAEWYFDKVRKDREDQNQEG